MRIHLAITGDRRGVACGRGGDYPIRTAISEDVTCQACQRTAAYEQTRFDEVIARRAITHAGGEDITVTLTEDVKVAVRLVLNLIGKTGNQWALDSGHCSTYDDGIEHINGALAHHFDPTLQIPARGQRFELALVLRQDDGEDMDAIYARIAANPRQYVTVR